MENGSVPIVVDLTENSQDDLPPPMKRNKIDNDEDDDEEDLPLSKLKLASPNKSNGSDKENNTTSTNGINGVKNGVNDDSDDDTPLSKLQVQPVPKEKQKRKLLNTSKEKSKKKQQTLFDMMKKGKCTLQKLDIKKELGIQSTSKSENSNQKSSSSPPKPRKPREPPQSSKASKLLTKYEKFVAKQKDENTLRQIKVQYNKLIRQMAKDFQQDKMDKIINEQVKNDVLAKKEKNRIDAMSPEDRKAFFMEKRKAAREEKEAERAAEKAAEKAKMCDDIELIGRIGNLEYKSIRNITSKTENDDVEFLEKYLKLPYNSRHLFPDILQSLQFLICYAAYLNVPGFKAGAIREITIVDFVESLVEKKNNDLLSKIVYALIRCKLSKKDTDLKQLEEFGLEIDQIGINKNQLTPCLLCWLLYTYLDNRYKMS